MLDGIKPLANEVLANLMKIHYPNWYRKMYICSISKKSQKTFSSFWNVSN